MKVCSRCKVEKPYIEFYKKKGYKDGHSTWCRECHKITENERYRNNEETRKKRILSTNKCRFKRQYGITLEQYEETLKKQGGVCRICGSDIKMCADHDHKTGKFRGVLCNNCNIGIAHFKDSVVNLANAIKYLEENC